MIVFAVGRRNSNSETLLYSFFRKSVFISSPLCATISSSLLELLHFHRQSFPPTMKSFIVLIEENTGNTKNGSLRRRNLIFFLIFLLVSTINHERLLFLAEGRAIENPIQRTGKVGDLNEEDEQGMDMRKLIGSRPPSCEKRCRECGNCEAVQVPILPQALQKERRRRRTKRAKNAIDEYSRGDYISNYKPMSWKCKCGDFIFNP